MSCGSAGRTAILIGENEHETWCSHSGRVVIAQRSRVRSCFALWKAARKWFENRYISIYFCLSESIVCKVQLSIKVWKPSLPWGSLTWVMPGKDQTLLIDLSSSVYRLYMILLNTLSTASTYSAHSVECAAHPKQALTQAILCIYSPCFLLRLLPPFCQLF